MQLRFKPAPILIAAMVSPVALSAASSNRPIDVLNYFLQSDDLHQNWTLGGWDVQPAIDPDGTNTRTIILNKFSQPGIYEVYKVTPTELQCRYEVMRQDPAGSAENWIRRFQEKGPGHGKYPGALWMPRYVIPGKTHFVSHANMDRYIFDPKTHAYVFDAAHSSDHTVSYNTVVWANDDWGANNQTGFKLNPVLRLISQWQDQGQIFECYDYSRGKGIVNWQWLQRLSTLRPIPGDSTGKLFNCENGAVYVESRGDKSHKPVVFQYNLATHSRGRLLEAILFTSYWKPKLGPQWYVIYRDLAHEAPLKKKHERMKIDYSLPEWTSKPGATIADLPGVNTAQPPPEHK